MRSSEDSASSQTMANPPFVNALDVNSEGLLAVGLGDGSILSLSVTGSDQSRIESRNFHCVPYLHRNSVASVAWMNNAGLSARQAQLWTAGTDSILHLIKPSEAEKVQPIIRIKLPAKPNVVKSIDTVSAAVASTDNNVYIYRPKS